VSRDLCARIVSELRPGHRVEDATALESVVSDVLAAARAAVPAARVDAWEFIAFLLARLPEAAVVERGLVAMQTTDLYLAFASMRGDPSAIRRVEDECIRPLHNGLRRLRFQEDAISDLLQDAREDLLVGREGEPALLEKYSGRGDLRSWVRVVVMRDAIRVRTGAREIPTETTDLATIVAETVLDIDALAISAQMRALFREEFAHSVQSLEPRERNLLRLSLVEGVSIDRLAEIYDVHRATAARWVERARAKLEATTLERLQSRGVGECESSLRLVWSQLDASVERLLALA
jgi:RNA polymerase sigma-70 factor (ECF subfamily)